MSKEQQLSLFELPEVGKVEGLADEQSNATQIPFSLEERVQVIIPANKMNDAESYYYLMDFVKKRGIIRKVSLQPLLQYEVEIGNKTAFVYHDEIQGGWPN